MKISCFHNYMLNEKPYLVTNSDIEPVYVFHGRVLGYLPSDLDKDTPSVHGTLTIRGMIVEYISDLGIARQANC